MVIAVSFGYLAGVVLRLFQTDLPDHLSAAWLRRFSRKARLEKGKFKLWATEEFPYFGWIGQMCKLYLPATVMSFYRKTWGQMETGKQNKQFFTFIKTMLSSVDAKTAEEMYAAEALSRYISGMFYALMFSCVAILVTVVVFYLQSRQMLVGLLVILVVYLYIIAVILNHYRFIRIKEVEIVFAASFKNRALFETEDLLDKNANSHNENLKVLPIGSGK